jgi:hypothetical protein
MTENENSPENLRKFLESDDQRNPRRITAIRYLLICRKEILPHGQLN